MAGEVVRTSLAHVLKTLEPLEVPVALLGGMALAVWGHPRATRDIDLLIGIGVDDVTKVLDTLKASGFRSKHSPPVLEVGHYHFVQLLFTPPDEFYDVQLDLLLAESEYQRSAIQRAVERSVPGMELPIRVLSCEDMILFKLVAGRLIDRADVVTLLRENVNHLDRKLLEDWAKRLGLEAEYHEAWAEAFPD